MKSTQILRVLALVAAVSSLVPSAMAQTLSTGTVSTTVNLTSQCRWSGGSGPAVTIDFGTYTAFQTGAATGTTPTVVFQCTRGFGTTPTIAWDTIASTSNASGGGVVAGLNYTLSVSAPVRGTGALATATTIGGPDTVTYTLGGTMPLGQAGAGAGGATTDNRVLTVTF